MFLMLYLLFFKQKTAYEMRISDWSSDVCSSDLISRKLRFLYIFFSYLYFTLNIAVRQKCHARNLPPRQAAVPAIRLVELRRIAAPCDVTSSLDEAAAVVRQT